MRIFKAGAIYFLLVFAAGFALGTVRQLLLVPRIGVMWAELLEAPFMLAAIWAAARWTVGRFAVPDKVGVRAAMGLMALALLLSAEIAGVLALRGLTLAEYVANREPVSGTVYLALLLVFAAMPWLRYWMDERTAPRGGHASA